MENRKRRIWLLFLLFEIILSFTFHSKKEALHAGYKEYPPPPIVQEFLDVQQKLLQRGKKKIPGIDLYDTNYTKQHLKIQNFCLKRSSSHHPCSWKDYYDLLHHLREAHETSDDLGLHDIEQILVRGIQDSSTYLPKWNPEECEVISEPSSQVFFEYVKSSRPFVVKGIAKDWLAVKKWNLHYLESILRDLEIYVGASPSGDFVGPEPSSLWNVTDEETIFSKPDHFFLPFSQLIESYRRKIMSRRQNRFHLNLFDDDEDSPSHSSDNDENDPTSLNFVPFKNTTLYMEYYPIGRLHSNLISDLQTLPWTSFLSLLMQLVWMGGGDDPKTSPLHFDKFENLMIMIAGSKEFKLFPPSESEFVYGDEASRGGKLKANPIYLSGTKKIIDLKFERHRSDLDPIRSHSTYTMVDLDHLNLTRFPLIQRAKMITCHIHEGDLLYVPSHWWHDVTSYDDKEGKSIGINHFFEPFYHLPGGKSRSLHHTLSEFYAPLRERETDKGKIELCKENEELICFRQEDNLKTKSRKKKPKVKRNQEFGEEMREQTQLREEKMKSRTTTKRTGNRDSQKISKARSGRRQRKSMKSEL